MTPSVMIMIPPFGINPPYLMVLTPQGIITPWGGSTPSKKLTGGQALEIRGEGRGGRR